METGVFEKSSQYADVKLPINNLRITWIDSDGVVLFDNDNDINVMPNHKDLRYRMHFIPDMVSV